MERNGGWMRNERLRKEGNFVKKKRKFRKLTALKKGKKNLFDDNESYITKE